ncbi:molybdopterin-guanine dinucleotide biosynthesis protein B [Paenibacillus gansuensis]|uniref:Molybdopterin-guanine dinucleotide biosynthesis protein B n=1 Tax=Paenibacillus gansuensis TaxID=306542 RepID=A0ABW5PJU5_9BACL
MDYPLIYQITGYKNTGKTTLLCRIVALWKAKGIPAATIKHDAHEFQMDRNGSDTSQHQEAGAVWTAITSPRQTVILQSGMADLAQLILLAPPETVILAEGFKHAPYPKLVMACSETDIRLANQLTGVTAIVAEASFYRQQIAVPTTTPIFCRDQVEEISDHMLAELRFLGAGAWLETTLI